MSSIDKTLIHSRDVLGILDSYREHAGEELRRELEITVADMRSGNYEVALTRLESRVGSSMMSDVTRGLISVIRGDKTDVYWGNLVLKFSDYQRTLLKTEANKAPKRVRKLSMALLFCFMLVYEKYASTQKKDEDEIPPSSISVEQVLSEQNNPPSDRPHDIPEGAKLHNAPRPEELP